MKFVLLLCVVAGFVHAAKNVTITSKVIQDFPFSKTIMIKNEKVKASLTDAVEKFNNRLELNIDDAVDDVLKEVVDLLLENQLDPLQMPDIHLAFEYTPIIITYHGELDLWGGWLQDIITIHRTGESSVDIAGTLIRAKIPIGFDDLIVTYLYSAQIMDLGPHGSIHGKLYDLKAYADITIDMDTMTVTMNEFSLDASELGLNFYGYGLLDWLVNLLIDVVEDVLHDTIIDIMNKVVSGVLDFVVDYINDILGDLLGRELTYENVAPAKLTFGHQMPKIQLRQMLRN